MKKPIIEFKHVSKVFEDSGTTVLKDISFELEEGKFYTLLGASGSGKSTILNIIAGLLDASSGDIYLDGQRINDVPTNKRDVHTVFQSYALFPHMTVFENVDKGVADVDVIIGLRIQNERIGSPLLPSTSEYYKMYGISESRVALAKPNALVMHPGPMNRGVEIASGVADGSQSVILKQVNNGIAVRMAVMAMAMQGQEKARLAI